MQIKRILDEEEATNAMYSEICHSSHITMSIAFSLLVDPTWTLHGDVLCVDNSELSCC